MVKLFGSTITETVEAFKKPMHLDSSGQSHVSNDDKVKAWGRLIVSILLIGFAVYSIVIGKNDTAGTIIGAVTGYWLK